MAETSDNRLEWKPLSGGVLSAEGSKGTWHIDLLDTWWHLTCQPKSTQAMSNRGSFKSLRAAHRIRIR
jgi:hypothetical protein